MVEKLLDFIKECPHLRDFAFNIDYLGKDAYSCSLSGRGKEEVIKKYTDGDSMHKITYTLRLRLPFGIDRTLNARNNLLLEDISRWFHEKNTNSDFPDFDDKNIAVSISFNVIKNFEKVTSDSAVICADIGVVYYKVR